MELELVGSIRQTSDRLGQREFGLFPTFYCTIAVNDAIATLCIDTITFLHNIPMVTLVLIGKVMSADEPCSIFRISLRGSLHVFQTLFVGDELPVLRPSEIIQESVVVDVQIVFVGRVDFIGIRNTGNSRRLKNP